MEPNPKLSIIIPTLNDNDELNKTIDSINNKIATCKVKITKQEKNVDEIKNEIKQSQFCQF